MCSAVKRLPLLRDTGRLLASNELRLPGTCFQRKVRPAWAGVHLLLNLHDSESRLLTSNDCIQLALNTQLTDTLDQSSSARVQSIHHQLEFSQWISAGGEESS